MQDFSSHLFKHICCIFATTTNAYTCPTFYTFWYAIRLGCTSKHIRKKICRYLSFITTLNHSIGWVTCPLACLWWFHFTRPRWTELAFSSANLRIILDILDLNMVQEITGLNNQIGQRWKSTIQYIFSHLLNPMLFQICVAFTNGRYFEKHWLLKSTLGLL